WPWPWQHTTKCARCQLPSRRPSAGMVCSLSRMDSRQLTSTIDNIWGRSAIPALERYIRIPNQSPLFDPDWKSNGYMWQAVTLAKEWVEGQNLRAEVHEVDGRTPLLFIEIDGDSSSTILMYGHLDKQPPMVGWDAGLGPWTPVLRDGKL